MKKVILPLFIIGNLIFISCNKQEVVKRNKVDRNVVSEEKNSTQVTVPTNTNRSLIVDPTDPNNAVDPKSKPETSEETRN